MTKNTYSIYSQERIVFVEFHKTPSVENFRNAIDDLALYDQNRLRLWDLSCGINFTTAEVKGLARYAKSNFTTPFSKVAIVAPDDLTFGLFRVHDVEREDSLVEQVVFRTKREALVWLRLDILGTNTISPDDFRF